MAFSCGAWNLQVPERDVRVLALCQFLRRKRDLVDLVVVLPHPLEARMKDQHVRLRLGIEP